MNLYITSVLCALLIGHYIGDVLLQSHHMATQKSKDRLMLSTHVLVYTATVTACSLPFVLYQWGYNDVVWRVMGSFAILTYVMHWITDYVTSPIVADDFRFAVAMGGGRWHGFFVIVFFDQLVHGVTLVITVAALGIA